MASIDPNVLALKKHRRETKPWWAEHIPKPDIRGLATLLMFALVFFLLWLIHIDKDLAKNELFKTVATLLVGSGAFGLACSFLWGGSKASVAAADTVNAIASAPGAGISAPSSGSQTIINGAPPPAAPSDDDLKASIQRVAAAKGIGVAAVQVADTNTDLATAGFAPVTPDRHAAIVAGMTKDASDAPQPDARLVADAAASAAPAAPARE